MTRRMPEYVIYRRRRPIGPLIALGIGVLALVAALGASLPVGLSIVLGFAAAMITYPLVRRVRP